MEGRGKKDPETFVETHFQDDSHYETEITTVQLSPRVKVWYSRRHLRMERIMTCTAHLQGECACVCVSLQHLPRGAYLSYQRHQRWWWWELPGGLSEQKGGEVPLRANGAQQSP